MNQAFYHLCWVFVEWFKFTLAAPLLLVFIKIGTFTSLNNTFSSLPPLNLDYLQVGSSLITSFKNMSAIEPSFSSQTQQLHEYNSSCRLIHQIGADCIQLKGGHVPAADSQSAFVLRNYILTQTLVVRMKAEGNDLYYWQMLVNLVYLTYPALQSYSERTKSNCKINIY